MRLSAARQPLLQTSAPPVTRDAGRSEAARWSRLLAVVAVVTWMSSFAIGFERAVLLLSLVGLGTAIAGLRRPAVGLFGIGILCTMDVLSRSFAGGLWRWNTFNYWLLLVIVLNLLFLLRLSGGEIRLLEIFVGLLVLGLVISGSPGAGAQHVLDLVSLVGLLIYFRRVGRSPEMAYGLALVTGVIGALGGFLFHHWQDELPWVNPNAWALFPLTPLFAVCLAFASGVTRRRRQWLLFALASVNGVWVFLSGSRGGLFMAVVCVVFLLVQSFRRGAGAFAGLAIAIVVMVLVASAFVDEQSRALTRIRRLFDTTESLTERSSGRSDLALGAWYIFLDHPLGVGTGGFSAAWADLGQRAGLSGFDQGEEVSAHSAWAKTLAENGVLGLALLTAFVLSFAFVGWHRGGSRGLLLGGLATAILSLGFLVTEFQGKGLWFLASGVMALFPARSPLSVPGFRERRAQLLSPPRRVGYRRLV